MIGRYQNARAFRAALEERLKQSAHTQRIDLMRLRRQVAFDRLLARLFTQPNTQDRPHASITSDYLWLLKGGYTFEMRLGDKARATKDLDLTVPDPRRLTANNDASGEMNDVVLDSLRELAALNLSDGFEFFIGMPMVDLDAPPEGGARYPIEARLDYRTFATFHLDVGIGDVINGAAEWLTGPDLLGFAEIQPARVAVIPREQQFAEKLHAYTLPRGERTNTRVKDLVDLLLLLRLNLPSSEIVYHALHATFEHRATHPLPGTLVPPPDQWRAVFGQLASEVDLNVVSLDAAFDELAAYWRTLALYI